MIRALVLLLALAGAAQAQDAPPAAPVAPPDSWQARGAADLVALDKINARTTTLGVKVGETASFGSLTIAVRACAVRPPDQAPDAAALLDITDSHPGAQPFHGWMFAAEPFVSMLEHPVYDVRVAGCR